MCGREIRQTVRCRDHEREPASLDEKAAPSASADVAFLAFASVASMPVLNLAFLSSTNWVDRPRMAAPEAPSDGNRVASSRLRSSEAIEVDAKRLPRVRRPARLGGLTTF